MERFAPCCILFEEGKHAVRGHGGGVQTLVPTREVVSFRFGAHPQKSRLLSISSASGAALSRNPYHEEPDDIF
jgi:hypothetical protein